MMFEDDEDPAPLSEAFLQFIADMQSGQVGSVVNDRLGKHPNERVRTVDVEGKLYSMQIADGKVHYLTVYDSMESYLDGDAPIDEIALEEEED